MNVVDYLPSERTKVQNKLQQAERAEQSSNAQWEKRQHAIISRTFEDAGRYSRDIAGAIARDQMVSIKLSRIRRIHKPLDFLLAATDFFGFGFAYQGSDPGLVTANKTFQSFKKDLEAQGLAINHLEMLSSKSGCATFVTMKIEPV